MEVKEILKTEHLDAGYDRKMVVQDIVLSARPGEILTLIGPNGSGKSTILKTLTKELMPIHGTVYLDFQDMRHLQPKEIAKRVSILTTSAQHPELMTCEDVVSTGRYPYTGQLGILSEKDKYIVQRSMERVHVFDLKDRDFMQISDGQRQRVLLARAICQEPDVLILDEPTSFLDIHHQLELIDLLKELVKENDLAVIMSLHELDLAQKCSDWVMCIKNGAIDRFGTPEEIFSDDYIDELYGIENGSYHVAYGSVELKRCEGEAKVFVIGGCGYGVAVYRALQKHQIPFACGILWDNDADCDVARALAQEVILNPAFLEITEESIQRAKKCIDQAEKVIQAIPSEKIVGQASRLQELLDYAGDKRITWRGERYGF